jgi:transcriptional regulator with XRE-family HTH domain
MRPDPRSGAVHRSERSRRGVYHGGVSAATLHDRLLAAIGDRSLRHIAELTGTHHESVRRYMAGQAPSAEFMAALCGALGISGDWLLTGRGPMKKADLRAHAVDEADASELLVAMAATIEKLIERVERIEVYTQTLETRLRVRALALPTRPVSEGAGHEQRQDNETTDRAARLRIPDARRPRPDDR